MVSEEESRERRTGRARTESRFLLSQNPVLVILREAGEVLGVLTREKGCSAAGIGRYHIVGWVEGSITVYLLGNRINPMGRARNPTSTNPG